MATASCSRDDRSLSFLSRHWNASGALSHENRHIAIEQELQRCAHVTPMNGRADDESVRLPNPVPNDTRVVLWQDTNTFLSACHARRAVRHRQFAHVNPFHCVFVCDAPGDVQHHRGPTRLAREAIGHWLTIPADRGSPRDYRAELITSTGAAHRADRVRFTTGVAPIGLADEPKGVLELAAERRRG